MDSEISGTNNRINNLLYGQANSASNEELRQYIGGFDRALELTFPLPEDESERRENRRKDDKYWIYFYELRARHWD